VVRGCDSPNHWSSQDEKLPNPSKFGDPVTEHDEGNVDNYDPQVLGDRLIGPDDTGVDELDRNGRSLNHPVPYQRCSKSGCVTGSLYT